MATNQPRGPFYRYDTPQPQLEPERPHEVHNHDPQVLLDRAVISISKHNDPNIFIPTVKILNGLPAIALIHALSHLAQWIIAQCPVPRGPFSSIITDEWCNKWMLVAKYADKGIFGNDPKASLSTMVHHCMSDAQLVLRVLIQSPPRNQAEDRTIVQRKRSPMNDPALEMAAFHSGAHAAVDPQSNAAVHPHAHAVESPTVHPVPPTSRKRPKRATPTPQEELDVSPDNEPTYDKAYVVAHHTERFYHAGGGMWKRVVRPRHGGSSMAGVKILGSG